jgi:dihydroflavonol-4-reductase
MDLWFLPKGGPVVPCLPMRVLVTGATGFLGGRLVRRLCECGHDVVAADRPGLDTEEISTLPCQLRSFDLLADPATLRLALKGVEAVCHVAALVTFAPERYGEQWRVNVEGTRRLLAASREAGVVRFVYTATVNVLGVPVDPPGDEQTPFDWAPYHLGYMDSKHAAEAIVLREAGPLEVVSVLPGTLFGPGDRYQNAGTYVLQAARGRLLAAPPGGTPVAHVDDVAEGHRLALERGESGQRYVLAGEYVPYATLYRWINEAVGRPGPLLTLPAPVLRATGWLADALRAGAGISLPWTEGLAVAACSRLDYSSERACHALGWTHRPAHEAVLDAVDYYRNQGLIS